MKLLFLLVCCFLGLIMPVHGQSTVALKNFVQMPDVESVEISPSGNKMAMLKRVISNGERVFVIEITDLRTAKKTYPVVRRNNEYEIFDLIWASDKHILLKIDFFTTLIRENTGRNPKITERRLMVLNLEDNSLKNILNGKAMNRYRSRGWQPQFQDNIVDLLPDDPLHILHAIDWDIRQAPQVFKVNLDTLERKTVLPGKENWVRILTDRQSNVRVGLFREVESGGFVDTQVQYDLIVKDINTNKWSTLTSFTENSSDAMWPLGFLDDPNHLLVEAQHNGRDAIFSIDLKNPSAKKLYYSSNTANVGGTLFYSYKTNQPVGYYTVAGIKFWDEDYVAFSDALDKALNKTNNYLKGFSKDENQYILYSQSDVDSGTYYLGNREQKSLNPVAFAYQSLDPANLPSTQKHLVSGRDGQEIEVFVTLPKSHKEGPLPTVIYSHHGRGSAAVGGFDYRTQLWANRNYAVIQVNFRHAMGAYYNFMQGDVSNWAPNLYQDLSDVTKWAVKEGYTDTQKTCLFGSGYAGYIALMAAAKKEHNFKCVATVGAMTDINNHLFNLEGFVSQDIQTARLSADKGVQKAFSPTYYAKEFDAAVLLAHGEDDSSVRAIQSLKMHAALSEHNKQSEHILIESEDSNFSTDESRIKVFQAIETLFAEHL